MAKVLEGILRDAWFLVDIAFWVGFALALDSTWAKSRIKQFFEYVTKEFVLHGKDSSYEVPLRVSKDFDLMTPRFTYNTIAFFEIFAFAYHCLSLVMLDRFRAPQSNLFYLIFPLLTLKSAHDILLDSTKKTWPEDVKRRHVLLPFELESSRIFADKLPTEAVPQQLFETRVALKTNAVFAFFSTLIASLLFMLFSKNELGFLITCIFIFIAYRYFLLFLNPAVDFLSITLFRNKFDTFFGDIYSLIPSDSNKHEFYGRQYQYFNFCLKPLTPFLEKHIISNARANKFSVGESKAMYYISRGLFISICLLLLNLLSLKKAAYVMSYYFIHATLGYVNHGASDKFTGELTRHIVFAGEAILCGQLFFRPIIDSVRD